ncbi:MAG TPA: site-2 protease family protein, partial [Candidatus Omnitrophota bacterium]|nr:site-2 protease family protein [Candidatus Omnitrophota bacterium]
TGITLFLFGGVAEMAGEPKTAKGEFLMAVAGPAMSVMIAAMMYGAAGITLGTGNPWLVALLGYLALLNGLLALFNLVPAFPLDGGRMLRAALWAWRGDLLWATRMATWAGIAVGMALMALGLWLALHGNLVTGLWWILIGIFVRAAAVQAWRQMTLEKSKTSG